MARHKPLYAPLAGQGARRTASPLARPRRRPVRVLRWVFLLALLGLLFLGIRNAYSSLTGSDLFRLETISVVGNSLLPEPEIAARAGLQIGGNLFDADLRAATERLTSHPLIRRALLLRQPPGTLRISLEERSPIALVSAPGGLRGLDREGALFDLPPASLDLPVITGLNTTRPDSAGALRPLADFVETLRQDNPAFLEEISEIHVTAPAEARVYLVGDGLELRMRFENAPRQVRNFRAYALTARNRERPAYVDLRFQNQVVVGNPTPARSASGSEDPEEKG